MFRLRDLPKPQSKRLSEWMGSYFMRHTGRMMILAIFIGVLGGLGAVAFHYALDFTRHWVLTEFAGFPFSGRHSSAEEGFLPHWLFFLVPAMGGLLSGILVYTFAPEAAGAGTDAMVDAFHNRGGRVRARVPIVKSISSILTIGSGGSAGQEGPIAQIGSGLGSFFSDVLKLPDRVRRLLLLTGTAAGLGAIFRAPLGGALTACEIIYREDFESEAFMPSIIASVVAFATFSTVTPYTAPYFQVPLFNLTNPLELVFCAVLGIVCAPASFVFIRLFYFCRDSLFASIQIKRHFKPAIGGLLVGCIAYVSPQAIGSGWEHLIDAVNGQLALHILIMVGAMKILTTSLTIGSGGSGGVFGPSLFIGGMLGGAMGHLFHLWSPGTATSPEAYVLVGMGAFFAGAAKAPIAGVIMVCEITANYGLLAPLLVASTVHIALARKWSIYEKQKLNKFASPAHKSEMTTDVLREIYVSEVFDPDEKFTAVRYDDNLRDLRHLVQDTEDETYPVLNEKGKLVGLLVVNQLRKVMLESSAEMLLIVEDMMTEVHLIKPYMDLHRALQVFIRSGIGQLPVVDQNGEILGLFRHEDIILAYDRYVEKLKGSFHAQT